ncbi:DUF3265 domain-containing protein [Vibrio campbellii]|nr:DUF3265 domain-containing protein [Vibrio campbellii]
MIRNAWHFCYALHSVFKVVFGGTICGVFALISPFTVSNS